MSDKCVVCGKEIPEGRQICPVCERKINSGKEHYQAVADAIIDSGYTLTRDKHRTLRNMSRRDFSQYIARLYAEGYRDGAEAAQKALETYVEPSEDGERVNVDWEELKGVFSQIKGIGPKTLSSMETALQEKFG